MLIIKREEKIISQKKKRCQYIYIYIYGCKDQIWLEPKTGMDPGPQSPNNKFVESGIKS